MDYPTISVIMPTYNRLEMLKQCIEALLKQSYPCDRYEIIVVDDGSSDGTFEWLQKAASESDKVTVRAFTQAQSGPAAARNKCITEAKGELIAFIDDDCIPSHNWLELLTASFDKETPSAVGGRITPLKDAGIVSRYCDYTNFNSQAQGEQKFLNALNTANALCPAEILREVGGFDTRFKWPGGEDTDLANRIRKLGYKIKACGDAVVLHLNKDTFRGLHKAFYNRGKGHSYIHSKKKTSDKAFCIVIYTLKVIWNVIRLVVETPLMGTWRFISRKLPLADAYCFSMLDSSTKAAKYIGHFVGIIQYK